MVLYFLALENRKIHRTPQNYGKKPMSDYNIHESTLTSAELVHLLCPLQTSHEVKVQESKLMHKGCFK